MNVREYPNFPEHDLVKTLTDSNLPDSNPFFFIVIAVFFATTATTTTSKIK